MSMDLEELIRMSYEQPYQPDPIDLQLTTNTHLSRLQSPSPEVVSASFRALATVAKFKPDLILQAIPYAVYIISTQPASPAAYGAFSLLSETLLSDPVHIFELKEIVNLACEAARVYAAAKYLKPDALIFIKYLFETEKFKDALKRSQTYAFFNTDYCLGKFAVGCLNGRESIELVKQLLSIQGAVDHYTSSENVSYDTSFIDSLVKSGIFQQAFGFIEREKCNSEMCVAMLDFVQVLLYHNCDISTKSTIRESFYRQIELLADFIHSAAYYHLTALESGTKNELYTMLLQKSLQILTLICTKSDEKNTHEKAQNFARDSKILNYLIMVVCSVSDQHLEENLEITAQAMQILQRLIHANEKAQVKLCSTIIATYYNTRIDVFQRLAQLAISHQSTKIYKYALQLLDEMFSGETLAVSFCASLSKPIRAAARGNVSNGLKLILGSFTGGLERVRHTGKQVSNPYTTFIKQCGELYKREVANASPPGVDICVDGAAILVQDALSGSARSYEIVVLLTSILRFEQASLHFALATFAADPSTVLYNPHIENLATMLLAKLTDERVSDKCIVLQLVSALALRLGVRLWQFGASGFLGHDEALQTAIYYLYENSQDELAALVLAQLPAELAIIFGRKREIEPKYVYERAIATLNTITDESVYSNVFAWIYSFGLQPIMRRIEEIPIIEAKMHYGDHAYAQRYTSAAIHPFTPTSQNSTATVSIEKYQELKAYYDKLLAENEDLKRYLLAMQTGIIGGSAEPAHQGGQPTKIEPILMEYNENQAVAALGVPDITEISYPSQSNSANHGRRRQKMLSQNGIADYHSSEVYSVGAAGVPPLPPSAAAQNPEQFFD